MYNGYYNAKNIHTSCPRLHSHYVSLFPNSNFYLNTRAVFRYTVLAIFMFTNERTNL